MSARFGFPGRPVVTIALVVVVATGVAGAFVLLARAALAPSAAVLPAADLSGWPFASPAPSASAALPSSALSAATKACGGGVRCPVPAAAPASANGGPAMVPAPFVQSFAVQPGVSPLAPLPSPTSEKSVAAYVDGCDHAYGARTQCVPLTFPPGVTDKCAWLKAHGFTDLPVAGRDDQNLDPDHDKIACD